MPSFAKSSWFSGAHGGITRSGYIPVIHKGKLYIVTYSAFLGLWVLDVYEAKANNLGGADTGPNPLITGYLIDFRKKGSTLIARYLVRSDVNVLKVKKIELNLDELTANITDEASYTLTLVSGNNLFIDEGVLLSPRLALIPEGDGAHIHYFDPETGSDETFDTGFGTYNPRPSHKVIIKRSDIELLLGRHYDGDNHRVLSVYGKSITDLGFSTGGGSPRPHFGAMCKIGNKFFIPAGSGGVTDTDNDIAILDEDWNRLATIDVGTITGWTYNEPRSGFVILGRLSNGNFAALLVVNNNGTGRATIARIYYLELASETATSPFSVVSSSVLFELTDDLETSEIGEYLRHRLSLFQPDMSDKYAVPVVDVYNKMVYFTMGGINPDSKNKYFFIGYIDISDLDIVEWNEKLWLINY